MTTAEILARLNRVRKGAGYWSAECPAHQDGRNSLSIRERDDGKTLLRCHAGCQINKIVTALGLKMADLFRNGANGTSAAHHVITLHEFATAKHLPAEFLRDCGVVEEDGGRGLTITYRHRDGTPAVRQRRRTAIVAKEGSWWVGPKDTPPIAYGAWRLDDALDKGELLLVEGETDTLTAWFHNIPALGIPGADMAKTLEAEYLASILRLYVVQEPDQGGATFIAGVARRLAELRWTGEALVASLPVKDLHELHVVAGSGFAEQLGRALSAAVPLTGPQQTASPAEPVDAALLGRGLGEFLELAKGFPPAEAYIDGLLSSDGGGWIAGEEKLGKTYYSLEEALCLALGLKVCGRFDVPTRRRVLFLEEEDPPRRTSVRVRGLLRGHGLDPDDEALARELDAWFRVEVWEGFTFEDEVMVQRLEATIADFRPAVVYIDVLRKVTLRDLNKADQAGMLLAVLDRLRRQYAVLFRVLHHFRKVQGFRAGRGSQELGGSFVLGAWAENSLFFEPIGRKQGPVRVEVQSKDGAPLPPFRLAIATEGPRHAPIVVRITTEEDRAGDDADEVVFQAVATLPKEPALAGQPGVSVAALAMILKKSPKTIRRALKRLQDAARVVVNGQAAKGKDLFAVPESC